LQQLFSTEELGDKKPTQVLRRIQQLLGEQVTTTDSAFLRELCLPSNVRMILAPTSNSSSLVELAELADKIMDVASPTVSGIQQEQLPPPQLSAGVDQLRAEVTRLQGLVESLTTQQQPLYQRRNRTPSRRPPTPRSPSPHSPSRSATPPPSTSMICWYHLKYGESAKRCKKPCEWSNLTAPR
jgi:hypothetical protein